MERGGQGERREEGEGESLQGKKSERDFGGAQYQRGSGESQDVSVVRRRKKNGYKISRSAGFLSETSFQGGVAEENRSGDLFMSCLVMLPSFLLFSTLDIQRGWMCLI